MASALLATLLSCACWVLAILSSPPNAPENDRHEASSHGRSAPSHSFKFWHEVLGELGINIGLNQLISGSALLICALAKYGVYSRDPHAALAYNLSLCVFSQMQAVLMSPSFRRRNAKLRFWFQQIYAITILIIVCTGFRKTFDLSALMWAITGLSGLTILS